MTDKCDAYDFRVRPQGPAPIDPAAEKAALEWLDHAVANDFDTLLTERVHPTLRILKAMLAEPRIPAEPTKELHEIFKRAGHGWMFEFGAFAAGYRALYAHLTKPKTKTIEVWHVEHCVEGVPAVTVRLTRASADRTAENARDLGDTYIHVTGPHTQEVPA